MSESTGMNKASKRKECVYYRGSLDAKAGYPPFEQEDNHTSYMQGYNNPDVPFNPEVSLENSYAN